MQCIHSCITSKSESVKSPPFGFSTISGAVINRHERGYSPIYGVDMYSPRRTRNKSYQQALHAVDEEEEEIDYDDMAKQQDFINPEVFGKQSLDEKLSTLVASLNKLHVKFDTIHNDIHKDKVGLDPKLQECQDSLGEIAGDIDSIIFEANICKGVLHQQQERINGLEGKITDLTVRQMSENITISGLLQNVPDQNGANKEEQVEENCKEVVSLFFKENMKLEFEDNDIIKAHRIGPENKNGRMMVVKCSPTFKDQVLANTKVLAKQKNEHDQPFFVNQQLPEALIAEKREVALAIKKIKEQNAGKTPNLKKKYTVKKRVLYVDGNPVKKVVHPPTVEDLFVQKGEQDKTSKVKFWFSEPKDELGSIFTAIAAKVSGYTEIKRAYRKVKQMYPGSNHIMLGYDYHKVQGCQDDGEHSGGLCIQKTLEEQGVTNKAVFVVRNFGGRRLGPKRFDIIRQVVKEVLTKVK